MITWLTDKYLVSTYDRKTRILIKVNLDNKASWKTNLERELSNYLRDIKVKLNSRIRNSHLNKAEQYLQILLFKNKFNKLKSSLKKYTKFQ